MNEEEFLPDGYEVPRSPGMYMKLEPGENRIRILTRAVLGWQDWTADKKALRFRQDQKPQRSAVPGQDIKHFWGMIVWNRKYRVIQCLEITQPGIQDKIKKYSKDPDWGSPMHYDLKIIKTGTGKQTKYDVTPAPKSDANADPDIMHAMMDITITLDAIFTGGEPFKRDVVSTAPPKDDLPF